MAHRNIANDLFPREIDIEVCLKTLKLYQKADGEVNCVIWDASLVLAKYLETICSQTPDFLSGMKVLELFSGLGIVGLTAALLGAQVTLTELPEALPLLRLNVNENKSKIGSMGGYAIAETFIWGDRSSEIFKEDYDFIMLTNSVNYEVIDPLIDTLIYLTNAMKKKTVIYLSQELHNSEREKLMWNKFYEQISETFYLEQIPERQQHENYSCADIILLKATRKN